ncbi:MAG: RidA family protein [Candidatus Latescibacterota bacterium]|jgi:enamine deaminase RidA (YjgF/YER057c/UK114 family)
MAVSGVAPGASALRVERLSQHEGAVNVSRIHGCEGVSLFLGIRPTDRGCLLDQARDIYDRLARVLSEQGVGRHHVVTEKVFLSDVGSQVEAFRKVREGFYLAANGKAGSLPATTYLEQPPCDPGVVCELQARVCLSTLESPVEVRELDGLPAPAAGKVITTAGYDHFYLHNLTGGVPGDGMSYAHQTEETFELAERILRREGLSFRDVIRTWIYLAEMDRDYAELNRVRTAFFERTGVERRPASTGIQGRVYPCDRGGALDLYAFRARRPVEIRVMHAPSLNEAWSYGSSFSRGMTVTCEHRTMAYISGTASIDTEGRVVHLGDVEGQVHRMLLNVEQLLAGSGATPADMIRATTYLKRAEDFELFQRIYAEHGFPLDIPHTVCKADVCRPEWLVEIEGAAIFPPTGRS